MKYYFHLCILIFTLIRYSISFEKNKVENERDKGTFVEIEEEEFYEIPLSMLPPGSSTSPTVADEDKSSSSEEFIEINLDSDEKPTKMMESNYEARRGQNEPSSSNPPIRRLDVMKNKVKAENYCVSTYDPADLEILLYFDEKFVRPGGNWWKVPGNPFGTKNVLRPYCTTNPLLKFPASLARQISTHEFFQSRGIEIPRERGKHVIQMLQFRDLHRPINTIEKVFLECACINSKKNSETDYICMNGKMVNLSRGVGGNKSFFVYAFNPVSKTFNVVAHICFL